jgi:cyclic beta-1,2-glucan synthetase
MNRLGIHGKGESVWLAWFLIVVLNEFSEICDRRFDAERAESFRENAVRIGKSLEKYAWDGSWYVRGFDDEGNAFGSSKDRECRIDSIAQTWSVLSQAADPARALKAMRSVEEFLLNAAEEIALLFTPPFVHTPRDPGYIRGYLAGIRENGGQYTHAATWLVAAYAELGLADQALKVFHMCSPITHSQSRQKAEKYKLEPYVVAGDIYSHPSHMGRGGWSWYTGSAAWLYRVALESILGFRLRGDHLLIQPCIPSNWPGFEITYRIGKTTYHIHVRNQAKHRGTVASIEMDQQKLPDNSIRLVDDQRNHTVVIQIADSELPAAD